MDRRNVSRESRNIIERVIRRYPENKREYKEILGDVWNKRSENIGLPKGNVPGSPVEGAAFMLNTPKLERIRREIHAVEAVYNKLVPEYQKVIQVRFWSDRHKNMSYLWMEDYVDYKEAQLRRITGKFIAEVGKELGEV